MRNYIENVLGNTENREETRPIENPGLSGLHANLGDESIDCEYLDEDGDDSRDREQQTSSRSRQQQHERINPYDAYYGIDVYSDDDEVN